MNRDNVTALFLAMLLIAVPIVSAQGGGEVTNVAPSHSTQPTNVEGLHVDLTETDVISGVVLDTNGELDILNFSATATGVAVGPIYALAETVTAGRNTTTAGTADANGWTIWNPVADDGYLSYSFDYTYSTTGAYTWTIGVTDEEGYVNSNTVGVTAHEIVTFAADPVAADGTVLTGANFGGWLAAPGATNVESNYIKITNAGDDDNHPNVTISFQGTTFNFGTYTIDVDNNLEFRSLQLADGVAPNAGSWSAWTGTADTDGDVTYEFTAGGDQAAPKHLYIQYRLASLPNPLPDGTYTLSYTASATA